MQKANIINMITNKYEPQQKHRLGMVIKKLLGGGAKPVLRVPISDIYKRIFFPQTIRNWNALPDSLISSAEGAEDGVAKFNFSGES